MTSAWVGLARSLAELAAPSSCLSCGAETRSEAFCPPCRSGLLDSGPRCPRCAVSVGPHASLDPNRGCSECRGRPLGFDRALVLGCYAGEVRDLCLRLKRRTWACLAPALIRLVVEANRAAFQEESSRGDPPWVVAVPSHWTRRLRRGYDQAEPLAEALAASFGLRARSDLRRVRATPKLAGLGRAERAGRLKGAFEVRGGPAGEAIRGRSVWLVDDILTTGATLGSAARAVRAAGAARVVGVVVARAEGSL